ncbi:MAG: PRK06851 family protein [Romboutsia sp.]
MEGNVRQLFPGGNTFKGSYPLFDNMIPRNVNRIFCLKGGPGVGKSSMMKKIGKEFIDKGYDVELFHCTSDPSSLDGVVIKELGVVLLDATAPHIVDPKNPGAVDEIVNLGGYWNLEELENNKEGIIECNKDISRSFKRAYKYLKSAEPIYRNIEEKNIDCMDFGKVNLITEQVIEKIFEDINSTGRYIKERHLFGTAITPVGHVDYTDSMLNQAEKVYYLNGDIGTGRTTLLRKIYEKAVEKGMSVEVYHYPLIPEKIETILIDDLKIAITISSLFKDEEQINLKSCMNEENVALYEEEVEFDRNILDELINCAISNLKRAKSKHDVMENYYVPNMRFNEIDDLKDELTLRILSYKNK